ncbi:LysR family transcriptional regulator [Azospirillum picis]|uniref:DNA-binding transcriptional LysR family regulator n=1 Tax=Azospirillum picis TaxID=488438 RepID=A0ABU0MND1_9PROT|nr:LysR family transcriptional regulator [Azospirillum picis]MBP2301842.1 DNA-binding transcriptional LysR family regulator [Azospirillum picis]MDQ0534983.1 DNA-binding transcriptional LysR family regulator [Azospirillum picis]
MIDLGDVEVLVEAVTAGSLAAAARRLGIAPMAASRRLAALEEELGVRLVHRTTRSLSPTTAGEAFLPHARALLEGEAGARAAVRPDGLGASGLLRLTTSAAFARKVVAPMLPRFLADHPGLKLDLLVSDHRIDMVADGVDLAIRIGTPLDNSLVARRLADSPRRLYASPAYLAARGRPTRLADLAAHDCLTLSDNPFWDFRTGGRLARHHVASRVSANSMEILFEACVGGLGIACMADWNSASAVADGGLVPLDLEDAACEAFGIWAVTPTARLVPPKVRLFVAALRAALA